MSYPPKTKSSAYHFRAGGRTQPAPSAEEFNIPAGYASQDDSVTGTGRSWENMEAMSALIYVLFGQW